MSNPVYYNVGWICALPTEYIAAKLFLDEVHEPPRTVAHGDRNIYTLGRMGGHNVVITVLPEEDNGPAAAMRVAGDMQRTFRNVRIGLMVGTGGGAPTQDNDIRLGDIVVSTPGVGNTGVLGINDGKRVQVPEPGLQRTYHLAPPPEFLLTAVSSLNAIYERDGHRIEETINAILQRRPRLQQEYARPDPSSDKLYRPNVVHPYNSRRDCRVTCGNDSSTLVLRRRRTQHENNPKVHYGLIASSEQLIKDPLTRDQLAEEKDVLCFDMQSKGLMNEFPCLVIRGISNYSDTHKNDSWEGYAAMAAAAYAKDILAMIRR